MCLFSRLLPNKKYLANKKNGGVIPPLRDKRHFYVPVSCGKCMECLKKKANGWRVRLGEEIRVDKNAKFVTFTFSDESLNALSKDVWESADKFIEGYLLDNYICKLAIRRFLERWRKSTGKSVKHWFVNEIGGNFTERVHIHGLMFTNEIELIKKKWKYGNVTIHDYVNERTINYIVKYLHKMDKKHKYFVPKVFASSGIGRGYLDRPDSRVNQFCGDQTNETYRNRQGFVVGLPQYFRQKIYTDEEREDLWSLKLDENVRFVNGHMVDVSKNYNDYYKTLEEARKINKKLGYMDDTIDWDRREYEEALRKMGRKLV
jgi:hypothetical protein